MSHPPKEQEAPAPPPEDWSVATFKVVMSAVVALVLFGATVLVTWWLMERWRGPHPAPHEVSLPPAVGQREINSIHQTYFPTVDFTERGQGAERHTLDSYGWLDRPRGLIHLPVEQAMDALAAQPQAPDGGRP